MPGVVEHGLFAPEMIDEILIAGERGVQRRAIARGRTAPTATPYGSSSAR
jgi:hypothetical protein